jgi:GAF domain-containing protein
LRTAQRWVGADDALAGDADSPQSDTALPQATLLNGIQDISQALLESCAINDILVMVLETIYRGLGFTRVLLLVRDGRRREMVARFGLGRHIDTLQTRFRFPIAPGRDLFSRAVHEQQDFVWHPGAGRTLALPDWHRRLVVAATLAAYPVVIKGRTLGLIYADREEREHPITGSDQNYLNTLRNQATLAIRQRS